MFLFCEYTAGFQNEGYLIDEQVEQHIQILRVGAAGHPGMIINGQALVNRH